MTATDPPAEACARCGAPLADEARFCTECGTPVGGSHGEASAPSPSSGASLITCGDCGAPNAASRPICARCASPLREEIPGGDALPADLASEQPPAQSGGRSDPSPVLLALVILAGLVTAGILLALVTSRVTGPRTPVVTEGVPVIAVRASSELEEAPAALVGDGDPTTAWSEASAGDGQDEFLILELRRPLPIQRVLIWNGHQGSGEQFRDNGRAARLRVEVGSRQFRVDLLDIDGPQAVDLPEPVVAATVRIVVEQAIAGARYTDLAISEVVIEAAASPASEGG